jgi:hypothetical protein
MKAIVVDSYGGAGKLQLRDLPAPHPEADGILVRGAGPLCLKQTLIFSRRCQRGRLRII